MASMRMTRRRWQFWPALPLLLLSSLVDPPAEARCICAEPHPTPDSCTCVNRMRMSGFAFADEQTEPYRALQLTFIMKTICEVPTCDVRGRFYCHPALDSEARCPGSRGTFYLDSSRFYGTRDFDLFLTLDEGITCQFSAIVPATPLPVRGMYGRYACFDSLGSDAGHGFFVAQRARG